MYADSLTLPQKIIKKLTPSKWSMCKFFLKAGAIGFISIYYYSAVHTQMKKDESGDIFSSIEEVIKNQYSNNIKDPFLSLLKRAEGFQTGFYADNKGYAVGYGYNPTQNSDKYNQSILDFAGVDENTKQIILNNSSKYKNQNGGLVPTELKEAKFTKDQLDKMAVYSQHSYEQSFISVLSHKIDEKNITGADKLKIIKEYAQLPENKKAVLIHMTYKVGEKNLEKYHNFFNNFINYLDNPTENNKELVANSFTYQYDKNGIRLHDTRVEKLHHDLFMKEMPKAELTTDNKSLKVNAPTKKEKEKLSEEEKLNKAMKEVNQQITFNGALQLLSNALNKASIVSRQNQYRNNPQSQSIEPPQDTQEDQEAQSDDDDNSQDQDSGTYYESSPEVSNVIVNGQKIQVNGNKVSVKN